MTWTVPLGQIIQLYNPYHHPAGSGKGGQFAPAPEGAGGGILGQKLSAPVGDAGLDGNKAVSDWFDETVGPAATGWSESQWQEREALKGQVCQGLAEDADVSLVEAGKMVTRWSYSSGDDDMRALAIQRDAAKEFGIPLSEFTRAKIKAKQEYTKGQMDWLRGRGWTEKQLRTTADWEMGHPEMSSKKQRALLRAMYKRTQAELKARGITEIRLYRGVTLPKEVLGEVRIGRRLSVTTNSLESWSISQKVAINFGLGGIPRGHIGLVLESVIPAARILSTPLTGMGCLPEGEVVVLGGVEGDRVVILDYE